MSSSPHFPVMLNEVLQYMEPTGGKIYVDGTFGAGGYTKALLEAADCKVYAIDRDPNVRTLADALAGQFPGRIEFIPGKFSEMEALLAAVGVMQVDGIVLDVGVSSMQIDNAGRGFSFMREGPLDMRMGSGGLDAAYIVNNTPEKELADIIYKFGGEKKSRRVARAIIEARKAAPITTTKQLAEIIRSVVRMAKDKIDPATRTFQALRIWVNNELGELEAVLAAAEKLLSSHGRLVVVTFHSLEDSIVKSFMNEKSGKSEGVSRHVPLPASGGNATFKVITKKAIIPSDREVAVNVRSRSAKLRAACKI